MHLHAGKESALTCPTTPYTPEYYGAILEWSGPVIAPGEISVLEQRTRASAGTNDSARASVVGSGPGRRLVCRVGFHDFGEYHPGGGGTPVIPPV